MMASPSSPSVRLTALDVPISTSTAQGRKNQPSGTSTSLKNGTVSPIASGPAVAWVIQYAATIPTAIWASSFMRADIPPLDRRLTFR